MKAVIGQYYNQEGRVIHVLAIDGTIWGSERNINGELGMGTSGVVQKSPIQFGTTTKYTDYVAMVSGPRHFCGIRANGDAYCAGDDTFGALGANSCTATPVTVPTRWMMLPGAEKNRPHKTDKIKYVWL